MLTAYKTLFSDFSKPILKKTLTLDNIITTIEMAKNTDLALLTYGIFLPKSERTKIEARIQMYDFIISSNKSYKSITPIHIQELMEESYSEFLVTLIEKWFESSCAK